MFSVKIKYIFTWKITPPLEPHISTKVPVGSQVNNWPWGLIMSSTLICAGKVDSQRTWPLWFRLRWHNWNHYKCILVHWKMLIILQDTSVKLLAHKHLFKTSHNRELETNLSHFCIIFISPPLLGVLHCDAIRGWNYTLTTSNMILLISEILKTSCFF